MKNSEIAKVFKALGDERRIEILQILVHGQKCACHLLNQFEITQPTLSHHMKILCEAGIVDANKAGKWTHYSISKEGSEMVRELFDSLTISETDKEQEQPKEQEIRICSCGKIK